MLRAWQKKHGLKAAQAAELLGLKSAQQVRNKTSGRDAITDRDRMMMRLWDRLIELGITIQEALELAREK